METSRINSRPLAPISKSTKANVVLSMPNITSPIRGVVDSISKDGIMNIKTSSGEVKIYSSSPLNTGANVIVSINSTKGELQLKVIPDSGSSMGTPVNAVSADSSDEHSNFFTFKLPSKFTSQLTESLQLYPAFSSPSQNLKSSPNINVDSSGVIQFLSYVSRGGLSDNFGKALQTNPTLQGLFPTLSNLGQTLPDFVKKLSNKDLVAPESKKLKSDIDILQRLPETLSDDDWQFMLVPINDGQKLIPAQFFFKKPEIDEDNNRTTKRFRIELDMDKLGHIIVDGLLTKQDKSSSLNLSVKTESPLPSAIEEELRYLFKVSEEVTGNSGAISFAKTNSKPNSMLANALHNYCKDKIANYWA